MTCIRTRHGFRSRTVHRRSTVVAPVGGSPHTRPSQSASSARNASRTELNFATAATAHALAFSRASASRHASKVAASASGDRSSAASTGQPSALGLLRQLGAAAHGVDRDRGDAVLEREHEAVQARGHDDVGAGDQRLDLRRRPQARSGSRRVACRSRTTATSREREQLARSRRSAGSCRSRSPYSGCASISTRPTTGTRAPAAAKTRSGSREPGAVALEQQVERVPRRRARSSIDRLTPMRRQPAKRSSSSCDRLAVPERAADEDEVGVAAGSTSRQSTPPVKGAARATSNVAAGLVEPAGHEVARDQVARRRAHQLEAEPACDERLHAAVLPAGRSANETSSISSSARSGRQPRIAQRDQLLLALGGIGRGEAVARSRDGSRAPSTPSGSARRAPRAARGGAARGAAGPRRPGRRTRRSSGRRSRAARARRARRPSCDARTRAHRLVPMDVLVRVEVRRVAADEFAEARELARELGRDGVARRPRRRRRRARAIALRRRPTRRDRRAARGRAPAGASAAAASAAGRRTIRLALVTIPRWCASKMPRLTPAE